jgi:hypothetical protein
MTTLSSEITNVRRLLHDANSNYWSDAELTDYINAARFRVVSDTGCNRVLQTMNLVAGQEVYSVSALPSSVDTIDILNLTMLWGSSRIVLNYMVFTEFNAKMRAWQSFTGRPAVWTRYGQGTVYVSPVPDQTYVAEWDSVVMPAPLVNNTDVETINFPYSEAIQYYAAYKAKYKEQSYQEAQMIHDEYLRSIQVAIRSAMTRRIPTAY